MKNPFHYIISHTAFFTTLTCMILILECKDIIPLSELHRSIITGILSSTFLLWAIEVMNLFRDKLIYGKLRGKYRRLEIYQLNEGGVRGEVIMKAVGYKESSDYTYTVDSCYHTLNKYNCNNILWLIELQHKFNGIYIGNAEYYNHDSKDVNNIKSDVAITLNLNHANTMIGEGSYKYNAKNDYGKYTFQINNENTNQIIVTYENTIPSGLAKGYEIWERIK